MCQEKKKEEDSPVLKNLHKKGQRKTTYINQKQHKQHKHQQSNNNKKTKIGRKSIVRKNKRNLLQEALDMAKKGKTYEKNWISLKSSAKQRHVGYVNVK